MNFLRSVFQADEPSFEFLKDLDEIEINTTKDNSDEPLVVPVSPKVQKPKSPVSAEALNVISEKITSLGSPLITDKRVLLKEFTMLDARLRRLESLEAMIRMHPAFRQTLNFTEATTASGETLSTNHEAELNDSVLSLSLGPVSLSVDYMDELTDSMSIEPVQPLFFGKSEPNLIRSSLFSETQSLRSGLNTGNMDDSDLFGDFASASMSFIDYNSASDMGTKEYPDNIAVESRLQENKIKKIYGGNNQLDTQGINAQITKDILQLLDNILDEAVNRTRAPDYSHTSKKSKQPIKKREAKSKIF
ncbi:hypothetical protein V1514DRAFT_329006 [Lipomyces japonicus]|uniref:uncharacterized protein n=1 Tax=Lipomyces japonicus TaxID=56871 RepID=UPI0034CEB24C